MSSVSGTLLNKLELFYLYTYIKTKKICIISFFSITTTFYRHWNTCCTIFIHLLLLLKSNISLGKIKNKIKDS